MSPAPRPQRHGAPVPGLLDAGADGGAAGAPRQLFYDRLVRVSVRHAYYDASGGVCRDFTARPSDYTAMLMRRMGLLFRREEDGFSVLFNSLQEQALLEYVRSTSVGDRKHRPWGRLCFELSLHNPWFVNFSRVRFNTRPARHAFYFTNRLARARDGRPATLEDRPLPLTDTSLVVPVGQEVACVRVKSVSDRVVRCERRCVPAGGSTEAVPDECSSKTPGKGGCRDQLFFDLEGLAQGLYGVETEMNGGERSIRHILYTSTNPVPLLFVELLLADPTGGETGVYPVNAPAQKITPATYEIPFEARSTWWSYYVVGEPPRGERGAPRIRQRRNPGEPRVAFRGPCRVQLPGGHPAWRFVSRRPIALARRPTLHLQLVWRREQSRRVDVLVERLPLADARQLLQTGRGAGAEVPPAPGDDDHQAHRARRLREWLSGTGGPPPDSEPRLFSDIYVHV